MTSWKAKLSLELLDGRIVPAVTAVAYDVYRDTSTPVDPGYEVSPDTPPPSDPGYEVVPDELRIDHWDGSGEPPLGWDEGNVRVERPDSMLLMQAPAPAQARPGFTSGEEVVKEGIKSPELKELIIAFMKDKGKLIIAPGKVPGGAGYMPSTGPKDPPIIVLDPLGNRDVTHAVSGLLFELIRHKHNKEQAALEEKVASGQITSEQFALEMEKLNYKYAKEHHTIAKKAVAAGQWPKDADGYFKIDGMTEDDFIKDSKKPGPGGKSHFDLHKEAGDKLREDRLKNPKP